MTEPLVRTAPGRVWTISLNRPDARNAVNEAVIDAVRAALQESEEDPECRAVILAGEGKDFCSGADVSQLVSAREATGTVEFGQAFEGLLRAMEYHPTPVVGAAQGAALGAGCQLLLACDLAVAAEDARIGIPSARLGIVIPLENVERLVLAVGPKRTAEMLLAGRVLTGVEAEGWGLVNQVAEPDAVLTAAHELAERVATFAPLSVKASKRGIRAVVHEAMSQRTGRDLVAEFHQLAAEALSSEDLREGLAAFMERRTPQFRGR